MNRILPLFRRALLDGWRGLLGWTAGIVAVLAIYLPVYSSLAANGQFEDMIASLPPRAGEHARVRPDRDRRRVRAGHLLRPRRLRDHLDRRRRLGHRRHRQR